MKLAAITRTGSYFLTLFLFTLIPSTGNAGQYLPDQPEKIKPYKKVSEHSNLQQTLPPTMNGGNYSKIRFSTR